MSHRFGTAGAAEAQPAQVSPEECSSVAGGAPRFCGTCHRSQALIFMSYCRKKTWLCSTSLSAPLLHVRSWMSLQPRDGAAFFKHLPHFVLCPGSTGRAWILQTGTAQRAGGGCSQALASQHPAVRRAGQCWDVLACREGCSSCSAPG